MKTRRIFWRVSASLLAAVLVGLGAGSIRLSAADAPAAPAPAPAPAPAGGLWFVFSPPSNADEVLASASRVKMLNLAKTFLERDVPELHARLLAAENPFYAKAPPPPEPVAAASETSTVAQPAGPPKLSDEDKLKLIGEKIQPSGFLEGAGKRLVTFSGSGSWQLEVGKTFSSTVPPDPTPIMILLLDANDNSCVLKLNNTTVTVGYVLKTPSTSRPPASSNSSQPKP